MRFRWLSLFLLVATLDTGLSQQRGGEIRGVWALPQFFGAGQDTSVRKIRSTLDAYSRAGINTVMILVKSTAGLVYYPTATGARDTSFRWDFLQTFLEEARRRDIVVHAWFCVFTESALPGTVRTHPEWLIRSRKGEMVCVVNPALPEVRRYEIGLVRELLERYPIEWVHLDYIRFPCEPTEMYYSYDAATRARFKDVAGEDPLLFRSTDTGNLLWNAWIEWNAAQVTGFLRELRASLAELPRPVKISAAVFPDAGNAAVAIGQDWSAWVREGLVDMLCPMVYTNNDSLFEDYARRARERALGKSAVCAGIGITSAHNRNTPEGVTRQIATVRKLGLAGYVLFSSYSFTEEFISALERVR